MVDYQLWGANWVMGKSKKLDRAIAAAMRGNFPKCRHNVRARENHGATFIKPEWNGIPPAAAATTKTKGEFPLRRKQKKVRRALNI